MKIILNRKYLKLHGAKAYRGNGQYMIGFSNEYYYKMSGGRYWGKASRKLDSYLKQFPRTVLISLEEILGEFDEINS